MTLDPAASSTLQSARARWLNSLAIVLLVALILWSLQLAFSRIYQVDEAQNLYMARILGTRTWDNALAFPSLFLLGPLASLATRASSSEYIFLTARLLFVGVFWLNLCLLTWASGERPWTRKGVLVLLACATLAPLWDYGFEVRHDNVLLSGLLCTWILARPQGSAHPIRYGLMGALAVLLQALAFKAFLYTLPLALFLLYAPHPAFAARRRNLLLAWFMGALVALLAVRGLHALAGTWELYLAGFNVGVASATGAERFSPWLALQRPLSQTPFLLAALAAALVLRLPGTWTALRTRALWKHGRAEVVLFLIAFVAICANPNPYPYNLVLILPIGLLLILRVLEDLEWPQAPWVGPVVLGFLVFTHVVPFVHATWRHLDYTNERQTQLMHLAEAMTDPARDRVYDAVGLVPTRRSIHFRWFLHSLYIREMGTPTLPSVSEMLKQSPAAVILPNYRTTWLSKEDWRFIETHYIGLSDDFWVLGTRIKGEATWQCLAQGRYYLMPLDSRDPKASVSINGVRKPFGVQTLPAGDLHIQSDPAQSILVAWLGPSLDQIPQPGPGSHLRLFLNWY